MPGLKRALQAHARRYAGVYLFLFVLFVTGIAFGALAVGALDATQRLELSQYLDFFMQAVSEPQAGSGPLLVARDAFLSHWRTAGFMFLIGLTVIGAPLLPAIVFLRGFIVGFSIGFLLASRGWAGLLLSVIAVLPQNVLIVPATIVLAAAGMAFATRVIRRGQEAWSLWQALIVYVFWSALCAALFSAAAIVEGVLSPFLLRVLAGIIPGT